MSQPSPARVLGPIDAGCIVIGAIIGVGIFFQPARIASLTGSANLHMLAWIIAGAIALCGALTFAALGARYHAQGAQYQILRDAYGPFPAFLFVFCNGTAIQAGAIGVIAVICAENLLVAAGRHLTPDTPPPLLLALILILGVTIANILGVKWGSRIQNFTVFAKVLTLLAVTALAAFMAPALPAPTPALTPRPTPSPLTGILAALVPALFSYGGWQHALWISGEVKEPRKNLPRAIVGGVILVIIVYLLANWAYLRLLGINQMAQSKTLAADAVAAVFPGWGHRAIAAAVAVSAFGVLNAQLLSGPRLLYSLARDGRFFRAFANLSPRFATPIAAILLLSGMALVLLLATRNKDTVDWLTSGVVFIDVIFFILTGVAIFIFKRRERSAGVAPTGNDGRTRDGGRTSDDRSPSDGSALLSPALRGEVPASSPAVRGYSSSPVSTTTSEPSSTNPSPSSSSPSGSSSSPSEPWRIAGYPVIPALFVIGQLGVLIGALADSSTRTPVLLAACWIVLAAGLYAVRFRKRILPAPSNRCPTCGYDLAGLPTSASCPECGPAAREQ